MKHKHKTQKEIKENIEENHLQEKKQRKLSFDLHFEDEDFYKKDVQKYIIEVFLSIPISILFGFTLIKIFEVQFIDAQDIINLFHLIF